MNKDKEIEDKINKLKIGLNRTMKKWKEQKKIIKSKFYSSNFEKSYDTLHVRNLTYTNNVIQKISNNLTEIDNLSADNNNKGIINEKFNTSFLLLQSICNVSNKYSADHYDYEIMSLKTINGKLDNIGKGNREDKIFAKNKNKILEEFDSVKVKITEGFDFSPVTDLIDKIGDGFKFVIDGIVKVGKFVGEFLKDFVILLFTLLKMLWSFVTKTIPYIIKKLYELFNYLWKWVPKIGIFTVVSFFIVKEYLHNFVACYLIPTLIVLTGAEESLAEFVNLNSGIGPIELGVEQDPSVYLKEFLYEGKCHPMILKLTESTCAKIVFFYSVYLFFFMPEVLNTGQKLLNESILWLINSPAKKLIAWLLVVDPNDRLFDKLNWDDPQDYLDKINRLITILFMNWLNITLRFILLAVCFTLVMKYLFDAHLSWAIPTLREISLVPFMVLKDILNFTQISNLLPPYNS